MNYPQQPYPPQYPVQPQPYPQQFAPAPQQVFPGVAAPPAMPPAQPLATGTLDDFYNQPSSGHGPSVSWQGKPDGFFVVGTIARDIGNGDVQQQTDPQTKTPKFYRDGRPMFVMVIPLNVQPTPEHPDGTAQLYVRGQLRDELSRAMAEAGVQGPPRGGDTIQVTLVGRKPSRGGGNPSNVFQVVYVPAAGTGAPSPAPVPAAAPAQAPAPQPVAQAPVQQPMPYVGDVPAQAYAQGGQIQTVTGAATPPIQPPAVPVAQAPVQQAPLAVPEGLSPDQAALLARITGQQA